MENKVVERNGFIYGPGTAKGFLRMERQGFPRPVFSIERSVKRLLQQQFNNILRNLIDDFKMQAQQEGLHVSKSNELTTDEDEYMDLMEFFEEMRKKEQKAKDAMEEAKLRAIIQSIQMNLEHDWEYDEEEIPDLAFEHHLADLLMQNQVKFIQRLESDGPKLDQIIKSFSIDKQKLFNDNMEQLNRLYLDNCRERIKGEENYLKKQFLERLNDYVIGKSDKLDVTDIVNNLHDSGEHMAQFFARDQLSRFNKAVTLATFQSAGVTKIKWITSHDVRVRDSHKALDGHVFSVDALPPEIDDYNCRCGLVPVEWAD